MDNLSQIKLVHRWDILNFKKHNHIITEISFFWKLVFLLMHYLEKNKQTNKTPHKKYTTTKQTKTPTNQHHCIILFILFWLILKLNIYLLKECEVSYNCCSTYQATESKTKHLSPLPCHCRIKLSVYDLPHYPVYCSCLCFSSDAPEPPPLTGAVKGAS